MNILHSAYMNLLVVAAGITMLVGPSILFEFGKLPHEHATADQALYSILISTEFKMINFGLVVSACSMLLDLIMDTFPIHLSKEFKQCLVGRTTIAIFTLFLGSNPLFFMTFSLYFIYLL